MKYIIQSMVWLLATFVIPVLIHMKSLDTNKGIGPTSLDRWQKAKIKSGALCYIFIENIGQWNFIFRIVIMPYNIIYVVF